MNYLAKTNKKKGKKLMKTYAETYKTYNRRTWLNNENSPSLGSVVTFDGYVNYSDGIEKTTYIALSDCGKTIKIQRNTETKEEFIKKIKLLQSEIELFINHLETQ